MDTLTPKQVKRDFGIPIRKLSFLIRRDFITPIVREGRLLVDIHGRLLPCHAPILKF